jgi:methyltransferase (TIGR00027 family)
MFQIIFKLIEDLVSYFRPKTLEQLLADHDVATTALLTNYWKDQARSKNQWHELAIQQGTRPKDLYKDSYLAWFYNQAIAEEAANRLDKRMWLPLATRTKYFRQTLSQLIKEEEIRQVLILGSGFDTLAVRKKKYPVTFFEIDYAKILACKASIYQSHHEDKNATYIGMDYSTEDFFPALVQSGFNLEEKTFILWEGNTFYLEQHIVLQIIKKISETMPHLFLSFDFMHPQIANEDKTMESFAKRKSPFKSFFTVDEMRLECEKLNLSVHSHYTTDILAQEYGIDEIPYHTAKPYSVITFSK